MAVLPEKLMTLYLLCSMKIWTIIRTCIAATMITSTIVKIIIAKIMAATEQNNPSLQTDTELKRRLNYLLVFPASRFNTI